MHRPLLSACTLTLFFIACKEREHAPAPVRAVAARSAPTTRPASAAMVWPDAGHPSAGPRGPVDVLALEDGAERGVDHAARADALREEDDVEGALLEERRALASHRDDVGLLEQVAEDAKALGRRDLEAEADAALAELEPDDALPLIHEARVRLELRDFEGARRAATQATQRDEGDPECFQALGRAELGLGHLPAAILAFQEAVKLAPEHGYALNNLGFAYLRANRNEEAVQVLTAAHGLLPDVPFVANNLGVALERTGRTQEAREAFEQAADAAPRDLNAQLNLERLDASAGDAAGMMGSP